MQATTFLWFSGIGLIANILFFYPPKNPCIYQKVCADFWVERGSLSSLYTDFQGDLGCFLCVYVPEAPESGGIKLPETHKDSNFEVLWWRPRLNKPALPNKITCSFKKYYTKFKKFFLFVWLVLAIKIKLDYFFQISQFAI